VQLAYGLLKYGVLLALALLLAGCAGSAARTGRGALPADLVGTLPTAAWLSDNQLFLAYGEGDAAALLTAIWTTDDLQTGVHNYRAAHLEALSEATPEPVAIDTGARQVRLMAAGEWAAITHAVMARLLPPGSRQAAAFYAQGQAMVAYRGEDDRLHIHPRDSTSQAGPLPILDEDRFAALAEEVIGARYPGELDVPLLFPVGEEDDAYVLFDLPRHLSVFLVRPDSLAGEVLGQSLVYGLRLTDALVLQGHLFGLVTRPVTSLTSLLSYTWHTTVTLLPGLPPTGAPTAAQSSHGPMNLDEFERRLDGLGMPPPQRGKVRFLIDGQAFFDALIESIQGAADSIKVRVYIFGTDDYALRIADLLKQRSTTVKVKVLVDYLGSLTAGRAQHGGSVAAAVPASIFEYVGSGSEVDIRASHNTWLTGDHTKTIVIDGQQAFIGGMNIDRQYRFDWHDMMAEVRGPIVDRLEHDFDAQWAGSGLGGDLARLLVRARPDDSAETALPVGAVDLRPLYTKPGDAQILRALLEAIRSARSYVYIQNPYVTDDEIVAELIRAHKRGVDVRLIMPGRSDSAFMTSANLVAASALVGNGVAVYTYPGMSHLKAALIDGWACFGSANLDKLSLRLNLETNLASSDPAVAEALMSQLFAPDFARSRKLESPPALGLGTYFVNFIADHL